MKKKVLMALVSLTLVLSLLLSILPGCGGAATPTATTPTATTPGATTPTATTPGKTTVAPTPTKAGEVIKWRFQTGSAAGSPGYWCYGIFCDNVKVATGGRLVIEYFPAGAIIGTTELFDGVITGAVEMAGFLAMSNWSTKDMRFELMGQIAGGMTSLAHLIWQYGRTEDDPLSNADKFRLLMEEKFPQIKFFGANTGLRAPEAEFIANKPLLKPDDYKGLTFRGTGWSQLTANAFGAKGVFVPGTDVYSALQTGVIDAAESGTPIGNYLQGYNDICKYTGFPGIHKLSESSDGLVNRAAYDKLPDDIKRILWLCFVYHSLCFGAQDWLASANLLESGNLQKKAIVIYESSEMQECWRSTSWKLADEEAAKNPEFKKQWDIMRNFQLMVDRYISLQTPDYGPDYPGQKSFYTGIQGLGK